MSSKRFQIAPGKSFVVCQGDITKAQVQVIVNAANSSLAGGGGVDGAIHRAAGPELLQACQEIVSKKGKLPTGQAVLTPGFRLPAQYVIHTVGPVWRGGKHQEPELLRAAYKNSLQLAAGHDLTSIAFPAISCGVYGYPKGEAAVIACQTILWGLKNFPLQEMVMYLFSGDDWQLWVAQAEKELG